MAACGSALHRWWHSYASTNLHKCRHEGAQPAQPTAPGDGRRRIMIGCCMHAWMLNYRSCCRYRRGLMLLLVVESPPYYLFILYVLFPCFWVFKRNRTKVVKKTYLNFKAKTLIYLPILESSLRTNWLSMKLSWRKPTHKLPWALSSTDSRRNAATWKNSKCKQLQYIQYLLLRWILLLYMLKL